MSENQQSGLKIWAYKWHVLVILLLAVLLHLNFDFELSNNEEWYLGLSRASVDSSWMPDSFSFSEPAGHRFLFQYTVGLLLTILPFGVVAFLGRLLTYLFLGWALGRLCYRLGLTAIETFLGMGVFLLCGQSLVSGLWIFGSFETKPLAYVLVFLALHALMDKKMAWVYLYLAFATWLHVLLGGWTFLFIFLYRLWERPPWRQELRAVIIYPLLIAPLFVYLLRQMMGTPLEINGVNLDWIYVYFRHPHHLAPFSSGAAVLKWMEGAVYTGLLFVFHLFAWRRFRQDQDDDACCLLRLNLMLFGGLFLFMLVAYYDAQGQVLKYYPFQISVLNFLLSLLLILRLFRWDEGSRKRLFRALVLLLLIPALGYVSAKRIYILWQRADRPEATAWEEVIEKARQLPAQALIFTQDVPGRREYSFMRLSQRELFVSDMFVPTFGEKRYEWYKRVQLQAGADDGAIPELQASYGLTHILSTVEGKYYSYPSILKNDFYVIYELP